MAKKKPKVPVKIIKPSSIVCIVAFCGGCEKNVNVDATFEVTLSGPSYSHMNHGPDEYCYCEYPSATIDSKRLEFTCPLCQYFSMVYVT